MTNILKTFLAHMTMLRIAPKTSHELLETAFGYSATSTHSLITAQANTFPLTPLFRSDENSSH